MVYNKTQINVLLNEHTYKLFMEHAKDMDIPYSVLGAWIIQTNIHEVPKNKSNIVAFHQKKVQDRQKKWTEIMHGSKKPSETPSLNQEALLQAFKELLQPLQNDVAKLKLDLGINE